MIPTLLIVDDEPTVCLALRRFFEAKKYRILEAGTASKGLSLFQKEDPEVILLDLKLPDGDGIALLDQIRAHNPETAVIMITGKGTIESAVTAMKRGATDYLTKPIDLEEVEILVAKAVEILELKRENLYYKNKVRIKEADAPIPGTCPQIKHLNLIVNLLAENPQTTVLIQGESGTGKELVARAIHARSARREKPFLDINCASLSETLLESELFGHERGAFTDAKALKRGLLEISDGGTLFLDEIGELAPSIQARLLRVLENKCFRRVGGTRDIHVDVRIVAATNKDLTRAVEKGTFREDLYYRLKVMPIDLPPLRERGQDILLLANLFLEEYSQVLRKPGKTFSLEAQRLLLAYSWPGNVRELRNVVERAMILATEEVIGTEHLPGELRASASGGPKAGGKTEGYLPLEHVERRYIQEVLASTGGNRSKTAKILDISRSTLQDKIRKYGL